MKRATLMLAVLAAVSINARQLMADPVVLNASFEAVQIGPPFYSSNLADIPNWNHTGSIGDQALWAVGYSDGGGSITTAGDGNQFVTMGGGYFVPGSSSFDQLVAGFTPGNAYTLTFKMASENNIFPQSI